MAGMARRVRVEVEGGLYNVSRVGWIGRTSFILSGRRLGASLAEMSDLLGINFDRKPQTR